MSKRWQKVELRYLEKHAGKKSVQELAKRFHTDAATVEAKLEELKPKSGGEESPEQELLERYQLGMAALYGKKWKEAEKILSEVAAKTSQPEVAARASQFAETARGHAPDDGGEDPYLRAVYDKNRGAFEAALAACKDVGRGDKDGRFAYLAAAVECLRGDLEASGKRLGRAFELDSSHRAFARRDPDLEALRQSAGHRHLFEE